MFLLILNKNPYTAAELVPDRLKFKQLLELCQLICSAGISDVFKPIKQGKELQEWVKNNIEWIYVFFNELFIWAEKNIKMSEITYEKLCTIRLGIYFNLNKTEYQEPQTAIFRYVKEYAGMTSYESNAELDIDVAINEYKRYLEYKEKEYNKKRLTKC